MDLSGSLVAFDLATCSGVAVGVPGDRPHVWSHRIDPPTLGHFLADWQDYMERVVVTTSPRPGLIVFESPILGPKTSILTSRKLQGLTGVCAIMAHRLGIPVQEAGTGEVTKFFTGFGRFGKGPAARVRKKQAVLDRCAQLGLGAKDDNAADAAALWYFAQATWCGVQDGGPLFK